MDDKGAEDEGAVDEAITADEDANTLEEGITDDTWVDEATEAELGRPPHPRLLCFFWTFLLCTLFASPTNVAMTLSVLVTVVV